MSSSRKCLAVLLAFCVVRLCCIPGLSQEKDSGAGLRIPLSQIGRDLRSLDHPPQAPLAGSAGRSMPLTASRTWGDVTQSRFALGETEFRESWSYRTEKHSAIELKFAAFGELFIPENSVVQVTPGENMLDLVLLKGSLVLRGDELTRARVRTYEGALLFAPDGPFESRLSWRGGEVVQSGLPGQKIGEPPSDLPHPAVDLRLVPSPSGSVAVRVATKNGVPLSDIPVEFFDPTDGRESARVVFAGEPFKRIQTNSEGVAETTVAVFHTASGIPIVASIPGMDTSATAQVGTPPSNRTSRVLLWSVLLGLGATALALSIHSALQDNPKLEVGTPTRVVP